MVSYLAKIAVLVASFPAIFAAPTATPGHLKIRNPEARDVIERSYIVVYQPSVNATARAAFTDSIHADLLSKRDGSGVGAKWDLSTLKGFQITADAATIVDIANSPDVSLSKALLVIEILTVIGCLC